MFTTKFLLNNLCEPKCQFNVPLPPVNVSRMPCKVPLSNFNFNSSSKTSSTTVYIILIIMYVLFFDDIISLLSNSSVIEFFSNSISTVFYFYFSTILIYTLTNKQLSTSFFISIWLYVVFLAIKPLIMDYLVDELKEYGISGNKTYKILNTNEFDCPFYSPDIKDTKSVKLNTPLDIPNVNDNVNDNDKERYVVEKIHDDIPKDLNLDDQSSLTSDTESMDSTSSDFTSSEEEDDNEVVIEDDHEENLMYENTEESSSYFEDDE